MEETPAHQVTSAILAAEKAQPAWAAQPTVERTKHFHALADKLREKVEPLARVITEEQGKNLPLARVEVNFTADYIDYMACSNSSSAGPYSLAETWPEAPLLRVSSRICGWALAGHMTRGNASKTGRSLRKSPTASA